jgi:Na+/proline symporter
MMSAVGDNLTKTHPLFAIHGAMFWVVAVFCYIAAVIQGIFALCNFKIMIKSEKSHTILAIFEIIFGGILGGVLLLVAGDGSKASA